MSGEWIQKLKGCDAPTKWTTCIDISANYPVPVIQSKPVNSGSVTELSNTTSYIVKPVVDVSSSERLEQIKTHLILTGHHT